MAKPRSFLRREILGLFTSAAVLLGSGGRFVFGKPGDHGIGGTGAAPPEKPEEDRGIGGTGVIGTIRRFGSIVVNGLRISYPKDVIVLRDGEPSDVQALRIGHVVRVVAEKQRGSLTTHTINVTSEVIGVVEKTTGNSLTVAGQTVVTTALKSNTHWTDGDRIAVSGLRHSDGHIIASLIEPSTREKTRVAGPVVEALDGSLHIADVKLEGVDRTLIGQRAIVEGTYEAGHLQAIAYASEQSLFGSNVSRLSIEAYVQRSDGKLVLGSGFHVVANSSSFTQADRPARAILTGEILQGGLVSVDRIHVLSREAPSATLPQGPGSGRAPNDLRPPSPGGRNTPPAGGVPRDGGAPFGSPGAPGNPGFRNPPSGGLPNFNGVPANGPGGLNGPAGAPGFGAPGVGGPGTGGPNIGNPNAPGMGSPGPGFGPGFGPGGGFGPGRR